MVRIKMQRLFSFIRICRPLLRGVDLDSARESNVIVGGDLNCALDPTLDKRGDILIPRPHVIKSIESFQNELNLHDIWRIKNPKCSPFIFCRLDYWLISDTLNDLVTQVDIVASIKTDQSSIIPELEDIEDTAKDLVFGN